MKWYHQIRWKLFISHLVIILVAVVALLTTANMIAGVGLVQDVALYPVASDMERAELQRFQLVVQEALLVAAVAALTAAIVMSLFVSRHIVEPLQVISRVSRRLAQGFYRERADITSDDELAELGTSINQLAQALEQTEERRRTLLADVTHELRTPLATIEGYMEGLIDGVVEPSERTYTLVLRESTRLQRLIEDLELLSRVEAGQISVTPQELELGTILRHVATQFEPQFAQKQITFSLVLPETMPTVWADPDRVEQIVINLLNNALRYTSDNGKIILRAHTEEQYAIISVRDTGIGIAPEHLPHLFERFYRVDKSRSRASGGTGIGLTITRHLVYTQGGEIRAESEGIGHGTHFYFTLPWAYTVESSQRRLAEASQSSRFAAPLR